MDNIEFRWVWRSGAKTLQYRKQIKKIWSEWETVPLIDGE